MKKRLISTLLVTVTIIGALGAIGCSNNDKSTKNTNKTVQQASSGSTSSTEIPSKIKGKKLKFFVVSKIGGDDHTAQFLAGAKAEGEAVGATVDTFSANGDSAKFHDAINQALQKDYDGYIISHGDDTAVVQEVKKIKEKGKAVVTFDSNADVAQVDGITLTAQDDESLTLLSFKKLVQDHNGKANIVYLWVDGFTPMVNRNRIYNALLEKYPGVKEVERFGVASSDTSVQTQNAVAAILAKHPKGEIDAIYSSWDAFAIGAEKALKEAGRTEIKIYGLDASNADLQAIQEKDNPWVETAAVDPKTIGSTDIRLLLKKIAGEDTPKYYEFQANIITADQLRNAGKTINVENLGEVIPGWGQNTSFEEPWIKALKDSNKK